jgi:hypothetical protein
LKEIASGPLYRIAVDVPRNRFYLWAFGKGLKPSDADGIPEATQTACNLLKPGFTALIDYTKLELLGLLDVVQEVQKIFISSGIGKLAMIWDRDSFAKFTIDSLAQKTESDAYKANRKSFFDKSEAEKWLNS